MDGHGLQLVHFPPSWLRSVITVSLATVRLLQDLSLAAKFSSISRRTYWFFTKSQNKCTETLDITFFQRQTCSTSWVQGDDSRGHGARHTVFTRVTKTRPFRNLVSFMWQFRPLSPLKKRRRISKYVYLNDEAFLPCLFLSCSGWTKVNSRAPLFTRTEVKSSLGGRVRITKFSEFQNGGRSLWVSCFSSFML